ncbi:probable cytosolic iron-sulfur protein assembly protein Ciao1 [Colias croceus]|uniref:probable cytosolic iron-sulfur protein assembly protein Ciao1 n=1 Tax=Colias crocea TaxID=72248 RepID=UPI001E27BA31|nr:probable cytosolic iron-sulfur protein assembly protein Ciao1 [Colias croceus]XP_045491874.1 probable cytosolic iron-sulfur protein assembly protein Ciao1 [Colias croceus]
MAKLELLQSINAHKGIVWNVSWHPTGKIFASCGEDKVINLWNKESQGWAVKTMLVDGHQRTIREVAWSPCGNFLASASFDGTTAVWDKKSGQFECNATLEGHENEVKSVAWSPSGQLLATCGRDKSVWVWEVAGDDEYVCEAVLNAHNQDVKKVAWHPSLEILASASYDNTVKIYKEDQLDSDWNCVATLDSHESTVWSLCFDKTGERLASCSADNTVKIWKEYKPNNELGVSVPNEEAAWKCICTLSGYHTRCIYDIAWCHHTGLLATASGDDIIRIFKEADNSDPNAPTFDLICKKYNAHSQDVNCVKWNPTGNQELISCSDDGEIRVWKFVDE